MLLDLFYVLTIIFSRLKKNTMSPIGKNSDHHKEVVELESLANHYQDHPNEAVEDFEHLSRPEIIEILTKVQAREDWMRTRGAELQNQRPPRR